MKEIALITGTSNVPLAKKIGLTLNVPIIATGPEAFGNGERRVEINSNLRHKDVFVIQSASATPNDHLMELFLILDALKRSSCYRVTTVMPCYPYARQDRKVKSRVPISAKLVADLIETAGTDRFITAELHSPQIAGFFNIPVDNLYSANVFLDHIHKNHPKNHVCVVAPDAGSVKVAKKYAGRLGCDVAMIYKNRSAPGEIKEMNLIGSVLDTDCIIIDDMADSCGTLIRAAELLRDEGAKSVTAYCTHPVLSDGAVEKVSASWIKNLFVTNTIDNPNILGYTGSIKSKVEVLDASDIFAEAIRCVHMERSLTHLFNEV